MFAKRSDLKSVFGKGAHDRSISEMLDNEVVNGGQFKGTSDGQSLNKIFHSIVLGSYQQGQVDTRMVITNDVLNILSDTYTTGQYPFPANKMLKLGKVGIETGVWKQVSDHHLIKGYGLIPSTFSDGNDNDGWFIRTGEGLAILVRFGANTSESASENKKTGYRVLDFYSLSSQNNADTPIPDGVGASPLLMPPVGLIP